jgi:hypothetical protein
MPCDWLARSRDLYNAKEASCIKSQDDMVMQRNKRLEVLAVYSLRLASDLPIHFLEIESVDVDTKKTLLAFCHCFLQYVVRSENGQLA